MTRVAVIGGGLSGLAAAAAAVDAGLEVELFEARCRLGGRAGSFFDPLSGELVDYGQHVAMGCCTQWAEFCRRTGIDQCFQRHRRLWLIGPDGITYTLGAAPLPAPFHLLPSVLSLGYLSWGERCRAVRAMAALATSGPTGPPTVAAGCTIGRRLGDAESHGETIAAWLRRHGQTDRALTWLWSPLLVSALSESLERISVHAARHVLREGFMTNRRGYELIVPRVSLCEIFDQRVGAWLETHGVKIHRGRRVRHLEVESGRVVALHCADGTQGSFDFYLVAVPWRNVRRLFSPPVWQALPELAAIEQIAAAPIAALHLWWDRPFLSLPHAALVGRLGQWIFARPPLSASSRGKEDFSPSVAPRADDETHRLRPNEYYTQVVISAAHGIHPSARVHVFSRVRQELEQIWPGVRQARLLRARLVVEPAAVFSVEPGLELRRPVQRTSVPNLVLAGDWTRTGWPATMESAVRSGYLAVQAIRETMGRFA